MAIFSGDCAECGAASASSDTKPPKEPSSLWVSWRGSRRLDQGLVADEQDTAILLDDLLGQRDRPLVSLSRRILVVALDQEYTQGLRGVML